LSNKVQSNVAPAPGALKPKIQLFNDKI
jgi:hypothetical protein